MTNKPMHMQTFNAKRNNIITIKSVKPYNKLTLFRGHQG